MVCGTTECGRTKDAAAAVRTEAVMRQFIRSREEVIRLGSTFLFTEAYGAEASSLERVRDAAFFAVFALLASGSAVLLSLGRPSALMASVESALRAL